MSAPSLYASLGQIKAEAARLDFVKSALTVLGLLPVAVGFLLRFLWMAPAFLWASAMWGWRRADALVKARQAGSG